MHTFICHFGDEINESVYTIDCVETDSQTQQANKQKIAH